jgi:hypothetical protein
VSLSEKLTFLIDLNADQAISGFDKVGTTAEKGLGKADTSLQKTGKQLTRFGAAGLAAAAVAGVGLFKLSQSASDYSEAVSAASQVFGKEAVPALTKYADSAAKASGMSKQAAIDGANAFGTFGKAAGLSGKELTGFSTELVSLAGDLASFKNTSPEQAITAITAALRGESEPMRAYGVLLDDATLKQAAMTQGTYSGTGQLSQQAKVLAAHQVILEQTKDAQGDYARTSDGMANTQRTLTAEMSNLKVEIGNGLMPVFGPMLHGVTSAVEAFTGLPGPVKETVGSIAGIGTVGVGAVSALALIAGKAISVYGQLGPLIERFHSAEGGLTNLGKAAAGLGLAGAAVGVFELGKQLEDATENARGFDTAMKQLSVAKSVNDYGKAIAKAADDTRGWFDKTTGWMDSVFGGESFLKIGDAKVRIDQLGEAFDAMADKSPEVALKAMTSALDALDRESKKYQDTYKGNVAMLQANPYESEKKRLVELKGSLEENQKATKDAAAAQTAAKPSADDYGKALKDTGDSAETATDQTKKLTDAIQAQIDPFFGAISAANDLKKAQDDVTKAAAEHGKQSPEYQQAIRDEAQAALGAQGAQAALVASVRDGTTSMPAAIQRLHELKDAGYISEDAFNDLARQVLITGSTIKTQSGQRFTADTSQAESAFGHLLQTIDRAGAAVRGGVGKVGAAAAAAAAAPGVRTQAAGVAALGVSQQFVTVNLPVGTTPQETVSAVRRFARTGGDNGGIDISQVVAVR